jgi:DNA-binding response OmpR family regulator
MRPQGVCVHGAEETFRSAETAEGGHPYAEDAEVPQRTQKDPDEISWFSFCALCASFASSAYGCPLPASRLAIIPAMPRVAVIEDDQPTSNQLAGWIRAARPDVQVDQWFNRDDAEAALAREPYDVVLLDIELGRERHAGVALINAINKQKRGVPVLVVSAMPAAIYRSIMKALDAWDYLQKTTFEEADFIETFLEILRVARERKAQQAPAATGSDELSLDPLWQRTPMWRGERVNLPLTAQRILATLYLRRGEVVSYEELFDVVKSGRNRDNVRKHVSTIRDAFREVDPQFEGIENVPMRGFRWVAPAPAAATKKSRP